MPVNFQQGHIFSEYLNNPVIIDWCFNFPNILLALSMDKESLDHIRMYLHEKVTSTMRPCNPTIDIELRTYCRSAAKAYFFLYLLLDKFSSLELKKVVL